MTNHVDYRIERIFNLVDKKHRRFEKISNKEIIGYRNTNQKLEVTFDKGMFECNDHFLYSTAWNSEVIGNVWENKELLEG